MRKKNGITEQYEMLKSQDENIENRVAVLYDEEGMRMTQIAEMLCVRTDTIRYIHKKYIDDKIEQYKMDKRRKETEKKQQQNNTEL